MSRLVIFWVSPLPPPPQVMSFMNSPLRVKLLFSQNWTAITIKVTITISITHIQLKAEPSLVAKLCDVTREEERQLLRLVQVVYAIVMFMVFVIIMLMVLLAIVAMVRRLLW